MIHGLMDKDEFKVTGRLSPQLFSAKKYVDGSFSLWRVCVCVCVCVCVSSVSRFGVINCFV